MLPAFYSLSLSSTTQPFFFSHFYSGPGFHSWQNHKCKYASFAEQLSKGAEWERIDLSVRGTVNKASAVPCVLSNYEVQEVAGLV